MALVRIHKASAALYAYFCLYLIPRHGLCSKSSVACVAKYSPAESEASMKERAIWPAHRCLHWPAHRCLHRLVYMDQKFLAYILLHLEPSLTVHHQGLPYNKIQSPQSKILYYRSTTQILSGLLNHGPPFSDRLAVVPTHQPSTDVSLPSLTIL